ncbi:hypothetical protein MKW98_005438 [Papaver atlanticum]|uniref:RWP-RK domain-containing protein n=1 Tax=Papaver atlanticum TaxID=357466 RepID=A0AAD4T3F4_9MAGN|nr:hypothetical protein MKW98_005438 [Papaver atlanticum]
MGDVTMPGYSNVEEDPHEMDSVLRYLEVNSPTLNLDEFAPQETGHDDGMVNNQWDWNTDDNEYNYINSPDVDFTNGVEGATPGYVGGDMGDEVETDNVAPFPVWPPVQTPFNCSYCQVLREIIHENGPNSMKLEIHGRIGFICHAIHETRTNVINGPPIVQMVDFTVQSLESVKQFIVHYCQNRAREGYVLVQDPLWVYYDALCYGLNWFNNVEPDEPNPPPDNTEAHHPRAEEENRTLADTNDDDATTPRPKPDRATQKRKVKALTLNDLTRWFHVTMVQAAKELQISLTVIKNKCRQFGVERWPHRTVESYNNKISILEKSIREGTSKPNASREIENLRRKLDDIYACRPQRDNALPPAMG